MSTPKLPSDQQVQRRSGRLRRLRRAIWLAFLIVMLPPGFLYWGAWLSSELDHGVPVADPRPPMRAVNTADPAEVRLAHHLVDGWRTLGRGQIPGIGMYDVRQPNAFSFGDGDFVLTKGLEVLSDESLDAAIAHEMGHQELGHWARMDALRRSTDSVLATALPRDSATRATLGRWIMNFMWWRVGHRYEYQADSAAVVILSAEDYPEPAASFCRFFVESHRVSPWDGGGYFARHPPMEDRMRRIRELYPSASTEKACR